MGTPDRPPWPNRLASGTDGVCVGRAAELGELEAAWRRAQDGERQVVVVGGEPGAGKTHLAATFARARHHDGAAVAVGRCFDELGLPFQPFVEVLDHLLVASGGSLADSLPAAATRELVRLVPDIAAGRGLDELHPVPGHGRRRLFDAVVQAIRSASGRWPLVLVLEDLHWAGQPTLQLWAHLVRSTTAERLLVIATHRSTAPDRSDQLSQAVAGMARLGGLTRLDLGGLGTPAIAEYLVGRGVDRASAAAAAPRLLRQTGGNPFLLRELHRHLDATGGLAALDGGFPVPRSIGDAIELRLVGMPAGAVEVLQLAAVIGEPGDVGLLAAAGDHDLDTTLAAVDAGVEAGILRLVSPAELSYAFVHDLARQALIGRIPPASRAALHARVARALEASDHRLQRRSARLAHHWSQAKVFDHDDHGVRWLIEAGREAERSLAYEEAAAHLASAAGRLAAGDPRRPELLLGAAANHVRGGAFADARQLYEQLAGGGDPELAARAAIGYEDACWRPGLPGERSVELLGAVAPRLAPDHPLRIEVLAALGRALGFVGHHAQAVAVGDHAIELARDRGDDRLLATALQASMWPMVGLPELHGTALDRAREGGELAERLGDWELLGQAATYHGSLCYQLGRPGEWRQAREQLEVASTRSAQPFYAYMARCSDHVLAYLGGDFATAQRLAGELLELGGAFGQDDTEGIYGLQSFMVRRATGQLEAVRPLITGDESLGHRYWAPGLLALYTELGLADGARRVLAHLLASDLDAERRSSQWPATVSFLVDAVAQLGDETAARRLLPLLAPYAGRNLLAGHFVAAFGSADRYLGVLCHVVGSAGAEAHFLAALAMEDAMGAPVHRAETLARYAEHLQARRPDEARAHRAEAHALATRLGMRSLARRTAGAAPPPGGADHDLPAGLTRREVEVLGCLAEGMSNREIATALFIAENTVANHVRAIMAKTNSSNRTRAARFAADHGLLAQPHQPDR